jgi:hypothetical protein
MSEEEQTIPKGYWKNASGALVPEAKIKPIDKDRHYVVRDLIESAKDLHRGLQAGGHERD